MEQCSSQHQMDHWRSGVLREVHGHRGILRSTQHSSFPLALLDPFAVLAFYPLVENAHVAPRGQHGESKHLCMSMVHIQSGPMGFHSILHILGVRHIHHSRRSILGILPSHHIHVGMEPVHGSDGPAHHHMGRSVVELRIRGEGSRVHLPCATLRGPHRLAGS